MQASASDASLAKFVSRGQQKHTEGSPAKALVDSKQRQISEVLKRLNSEEDLCYSTSISKHASMIATGQAYESQVQLGGSLNDAPDNPAKLSWLSNKSLANQSKSGLTGGRTVKELQSQISKLTEMMADVQTKLNSPRRSVDMPVDDRSSQGRCGRQRSLDSCMRREGDRL